jgi:hypothetical protein
VCSIENEEPPKLSTLRLGGPSPLAGFNHRFDATTCVARLTSLTQAARLRPKCSVLFFFSSGATSCVQRPRSRPIGVKLPIGDRSMNRSRVLTARSRSDQNRAIESHGDNANVQLIAQWRKETEFVELNDG